MPAAKYREPITIEKVKAEATANSLGELDLEDDANWETHFECFAEVHPKGTREFTRAGILDADVAHRILVRRSSETEAITGEMRVRWNEAKLGLLAAFAAGTDHTEIEIHTRS